MAEVGCGEPWEQLKLTWESRGDAPYKMHSGASVAHGSMCYFRSGYAYSDDVFGYDSEKNEWSELPVCPQSEFGLAIINNLLTAVGGVSNTTGKCVNDLVSFKGSEWVKIFPPMPTERLNHAVTTMQNYLIAVGGLESRMAGPLSIVEVMDMNILEWYTAASLPEPVYHLSATVCGGRLYLLGGYDKYSNETHAVFTCTLDSLIRSCHPPSQTPPHTSDASVWQRVADVPVWGSTCTTLNGRMLTIGGEDTNGYTAAVHIYNPKSDLWLLAGCMHSARSRCLVVALHNRIIAVGGSTQAEGSTVECGGEGDTARNNFTCLEHGTLSQGIVLL